ncbi:MAG: hypothetical protein ABSH47_19720 [Bryobacteraceae bacterium]
MEQEVQEIVEEQPAEVESVPESPIAPHWLRLALAIEFLVALIAVTVTWQEIGGQGHLDLMPWYVKLTAIGGACWAFVRFSAALARPGKWRTRRSLGWFCAVLALVAAMGLITYYYHLHEPADDSDTDENPSTSVSVPDRPATGEHL